VVWLAADLYLGRAALQVTNSIGESEIGLLSGDSSALASAFQIPVYLQLYLLIKGWVVYPPRLKMRSTYTMVISIYIRYQIAGSRCYYFYGDVRTLQLNPLI